MVFEDKDHPLRYVSAGVSEDEKYAFLTVSEGTSGTELYWRDLTKPGSAFALLMKGFDHDSARHRQRRRQVPGPDQPRGAQRQGHPDRPQAARRKSWTVDHPREARGPERGGDRRRPAVLHLPQGRQHQDLPVRPGREARPGDRRFPALGTAGGLRRLARRHDPLLHLHLVHLSADHLQVRHRQRRAPRSSASPRSSSTPRATRPSRSFTPARTGPRCRCSSSTRRAWPWTGRTPAS